MTQDELTALRKQAHAQLKSKKTRVLLADRVNGYAKRKLEEHNGTEEDLAEDE